MSDVSPTTPDPFNPSAALLSKLGPHPTDVAAAVRAGGDMTRRTEAAGLIFIAIGIVIAVTLVAVAWTVGR